MGTTGVGDVSGGGSDVRSVLRRFGIGWASRSDEIGERSGAVERDEEEEEEEEEGEEVLERIGGRELVERRGGNMSEGSRGWYIRDVEGGAGVGVSNAENRDIRTRVSGNTQSTERPAENNRARNEDRRGDIARGLDRSGSVHSTERTYAWLDRDRTRDSITPTPVPENRRSRSYRHSRSASINTNITTTSRSIPSRRAPPPPTNFQFGTRHERSQVVITPTPDSGFMRIEELLEQEVYTGRGEGRVGGAALGGRERRVNMAGIEVFRYGGAGGVRREEDVRVMVQEVVEREDLEW
jgi:hypothetical protein